MRSFRFTPLNLATAALLLLAVYVAMNGAAFTGQGNERWSTAIAALFALLAVATFFLDLIFRNFFPETRRLWIIELAFMALTTVIFLLIKS
ncbi:MAG: hypothetical protein INR69_01380 [Mucilaginibacter polytrichastri]|nr:hypothetical protein [Mucilaginibacter polytrichastri]